MPLPKLRRFENRRLCFAEAPDSTGAKADLSSVAEGEGGRCPSEARACCV